MIILPFLVVLVVPTSSPAYVQSFVSALHREFNPVLVPYLYEIARCESELHQFNATGTVLTSPTDDFGILQINGVHEKEAEELGLDFKGSMDDNVKMAKVVFDKQGLGAWTCAKKKGFVQ